MKKVLLYSIPLTLLALVFWGYSFANNFYSLGDNYRRVSWNNDADKSKKIENKISLKSYINTSSLTDTQKSALSQLQTDYQADLKLVWADDQDLHL